MFFTSFLGYVYTKYYGGWEFEDLGGENEEGERNKGKIV